MLRIAGYGSMIGLSVIATAVVARHLGVRGFGRYNTIISLVMMLATVTDAGMSNVALREYAVLQGERREKLIADLFGLRTLLTLGGTGLAVAYAVLAGYDGALVLGTALASLGTVLLLAQHTLTLPFANALRLGLLAGLEVARQAIWVGGLVVLSALGAGTLPLLATLLVANVVMLVPTLALAKDHPALWSGWRPHDWFALLRRSAAFSLATAVGTVYLSITQLITSLVASPHEVGLFSVSFRVFIVAVGIPALAAASALPELARLAESDRQRLADALRRFGEVALVAGVGVAVVLSAGAPFIVKVLGGGQFAGSVPVLRLQAFAMIGTFASAPASFGLLAIGAYRPVLVVNAVALSATGVAAGLLAASSGATGAAAATVGGEALVAVMMGIALARSDTGVLPRPRRLAAVALAGAVAAVPGFALGLPAVLAAALAALVFGALAILLRALPAEIVAQLLPGSRPLAG